MDPRLHHPLPILTYMAQAHAPDGLPPQLPPMPPMPGVAPTSAPDGGPVSDADLDKHMIAKGLARLPEPHTDADLELLWRTLSNEYPHRTPAGWQTHFAAHREEIMQILKIIVDNLSVSNAHYSFSEEELLVNFYAAGGPSSSSTSPLSWKSFALENPSRTHDAWRMYGKRNRARLETRIQVRRQEFRDRGIAILEEIRSRPGNRARGSDASVPDFGTSSPRASTSAAGQGSPPGSVRRKTRRQPAAEDGPGDDGVDHSGDDDAYEGSDDGNEAGTSRKSKGKARRIARRSLQRSTIDAAGGRGGKRRQSITGSQMSRGSVANDDEDPGGSHRYVPSDDHLTAESYIHSHERGGMKLMFTLDDRVALVQLLAQSGPNPSPADLLRFAARHKEHSLEDWLRLCDEEHEALLKEAELVRPMPPSAQRILHSQSQPAQSALRDDHIDPKIRDVPHQQENEQFQKQYEQHVQSSHLSIVSSKETENTQQDGEQMREERFEDAPMTVVPEQLAKCRQEGGTDGRSLVP